MTVRLAIPLAFLAGAAAADVLPLTVENLEWDRCVRMMDAYGRAYAEHGWGTGQLIEAEGRRQRALVTGAEIIILDCSGEPATFTRSVEEM